MNKIFMALPLASALQNVHLISLDQARHHTRDGRKVNISGVDEAFPAFLTFQGKKL
jgi:hypothetical protein